MILGVVGYSTRALVQAVKELGHTAIAIDAFGDQDTLDLAQAVHVVDDWPAGIRRAVERCKVDGWLLGGGMEHVVLDSGFDLDCNAGTGTSRSRSRSRETLAPILGPDLEQMNLLRSTAFWESLCCEGIYWPKTTYDHPNDDRWDWLLKPLRSAGGLAIRTRSEEEKPLNQLQPDEAIDKAEYYWQRKIEGRVLGVTWIMHAGSCLLLGITQALSDRDWPGPSQFVYRGSFGPIVLETSQLTALTKLGQRVLAALPGVRGYLQADLIEDEAGRLWLLEFNPRWTAGMEILHEAASSAALTPLAQHLQAWGIPSDSKNWCRPATKLVSKAIYYSASDVELDQTNRLNLQSLRAWQKSIDSDSEWCLADVPPVASEAPMRFQHGMPILTVKSRSWSTEVQP